MVARTLVALVALTAVARAADTREINAREAFAAGRYQEAVDLYAKLYASTLHPTYLRNIGRCYQNLDQPEKASKSFREYLRKAKVTAAEREEVEGYIREMELLGQKKSAPPAPAPPSAAPPPPAPAAPLPFPAAAPPVDLTTRPPPPESSPFYTRWWFWTGVAIVAAGATTAILLSRGGDGAPATDYGPYSPPWK